MDLDSVMVLPGTKEQITQWAEKNGTVFCKQL